MSRLFTIASVVVHAVVIAAVLVAQLIAIGPLPTPRQPLTFDGPRRVDVDIKLARPPRRSSGGAPAASISVAAPIVEPRGIDPETVREPAVFTPGVDARIGLDGGTGAIGVGTMERVVPPPPLPATPTQPIRLHAGIQAPRKIVDVAPIYPSLARMAHVEGVVILEAVIDARGNVESVRVLRSIPQLDQAAADAVRQWRFTPARLNTETVPVVMTVTVNFTLQNL